MVHFKIIEKPFIIRRNNANPLRITRIQDPIKLVNKEVAYPYVDLIKLAIKDYS